MFCAKLFWTLNIFGPEIFLSSILFWTYIVWTKKNWQFFFLFFTNPFFFTKNNCLEPKECQIQISLLYLDFVGSKFIHLFLTKEIKWVTIKPGSDCFCSWTVSAWTELQFNPRPGQFLSFQLNWLFWFVFSKLAQSITFLFVFSHEKPQYV